MKLFEPGTIGKIRIKNRVVMAAISSGAFAELDGRLSERLIDCYIARAKGGTGLIITSGFGVTREIEQPLNTPFSRGLKIGSDLYIARLNQLSEAVHDFGAKVFVQLSAGVGRNAPPAMLRMMGAVGPSPNPAFFDSTVIARELTTEEVERLVKAFETAARIASAAGIDGVEINCHGGYLFDEFTSPLWNRRTDKYGGDLDGRLRFSLEVIEAVKRGGGADFPVVIKFALTHYIPGGRDVDEGLEIARRWEDAGVDGLDIDAGCYEVRYWDNPPTTLPMGCMVDLAAMVKNVVKIPVVAVGKLGDPEIAEKVLLEQKADFIALARPLLADPEWVNKIKEGRTEDICPCIGDHEGCHKRLYDRKFFSCTVNPACGREKEFALNPVDRKKLVLVIGGGPGGMMAANIAALRNHKVILVDKSTVLGGNLIAASVPDFKQEYRSLISYFSTQIKKVGVDVRLGIEATPEFVDEINPEVILIATGSEPIFPEIPGINKGNVITAVDCLLNKRGIGESVVVIGGGIVGCETALYLAKKGKKVIIVEILDMLMRDVYSINRKHLEQLLREINVEILTGTRVLEIKDASIILTDKYGGNSTRKVSTTVLATGFKPNNKLVNALKGKRLEMYPIGDCVQPRKVINAIWEGSSSARLI